MSLLMSKEVSDSSTLIPVMVWFGYAMVYIFKLTVPFLREVFPAYKHKRYFKDVRQAYSKYLICIRTLRFQLYVYK